MPKKLAKPDSSLLRYQLAQFTPDRYASLLESAQSTTVPRNKRIDDARVTIQCFVCSHGLPALFSVFEEMSKEQAA